MTYPAQRSSSPGRRPRPPAPPYPEDPYTATRHLCAGAYLDDTFRNTCLREVYHQPRRLVAPSHGFDVVPVLGHCLKARNAALIRDGAIVLTLLVALCASGGTAVFVLSMLAGLQTVIGTYRLSRDVAHDLRRGRSIEFGAVLSRIFLLTLGWVLASVLWLLSWSLLAGQTTALLYAEGPAGIGTALAGIAAGGLVLSFLVFAYPVAFSLWRQSQLSGLRPGSRIVPPVRSGRLEEIDRQQRGNTAVYSGFRPFVGSGDLVETWGFAQRLVRPEPSVADSVHDGLRRAAGARPTERQREFAEPPFDAQEIVDYVREHLSTLLPHREAEEQIAGLSVEDRVLLAGTEVSHLSPYTDPEVMLAVVRHPTTPARHYLACQVFAWGGELITTVYVHLAVQGRSLYLELTTTVLPPCDADFRIVSAVAGTGAAAWVRALARGLLDTPRTIGRAPLGLAGAVLDLIAASGQAGDPAPLARGYDYGARVGVRELGSDTTMRNLTQLQDVEKYQKLIERRVIASVLDFLDIRGVDTTEYRARASAVLSVNAVNNSGTAIYHGPVAGGNMTVGEAA
jgi:hypothetical protein